MLTAVKVGGYAIGLLAIFAAAMGIGAAVTPTATTAATPTSDQHDGMESTSVDATAALPAGLMVTQDGYTLRLADGVLPAGSREPLRFAILGPDGAPVTAYRSEHDKDLHLIAVRRDLSHFQHVHPVLDAQGTWSVPLDLSAAGDYRVFADFTPAGHDRGLVLGADVAVPGSYEPVPIPEPTSTAHVLGGYQVTLDGGLMAGHESKLTLTVYQDGVPITDLQPYLAAYGHLVAVRVGDLAYLHVHPAGAPGDGVTLPGPGITFYATAPSAGDYRLYLDFQHAGVVRTAEFTVRAEKPAGAVPDSIDPATVPDDTETDGHGR